MAALLPPPPINTLPSGLLDLLGIRSGGEYPRDLSSQLAGSIELLPFYLAQRQETIVSSGFTVNATGTNVITGLTVPSGELWHVHGATLRVVSGVGEAVACEPAWQFEPTGVAVAPQVLGSAINLAASVTASCFMSVERFIAPPGSSLAVVVNSITGVIDVLGVLRICRMKF